MLSILKYLQVPLLLSMGENELGLKKAILSGEDDLVYLSVMHIEQEAGSSEKGREAFCELMHAHPEALRLLKVSSEFEDFDEAKHAVILAPKL